MTLTAKQIAVECGITVRTVLRHMEVGTLAYYSYGLGDIRPHGKRSTRQQVDDWKRRCLVDGPREIRPEHPKFRNFN